MVPFYPQKWSGKWVELTCDVILARTFCLRWTISKVAVIINGSSHSESLADLKKKVPSVPERVNDALSTLTDTTLIVKITLLFYVLSVGYKAFSNDKQTICPIKYNSKDIILFFKGNCARCIFSRNTLINIVSFTLKGAFTSLHRNIYFIVSLWSFHWPSLHLVLTEVSIQVQLYFRKEVPTGHRCNGGHSHSHLDLLSTFPLRIQRSFIFCLQSQSQMSGFHSSLLLRLSQSLCALMHSHWQVLSLNVCILVLHELRKVWLQLHSQVSSE